MCLACMSLLEDGGDISQLSGEFVLGPKGMFFSVFVLEVSIVVDKGFPFKIS